TAHDSPGGHEDDEGQDGRNRGADDRLAVAGGSLCAIPRRRDRLPAGSGRPPPPLVPCLLRRPCGVEDDVEVLRTDVAIIGGGLGACAAALAVARLGPGYPHRRDSLGGWATHQPSCPAGRASVDRGIRRDRKLPCAAHGHSQLLSRLAPAYGR